MTEPVCTCSLTPDNETERRKNFCPIHGLQAKEQHRSEVARILAQIGAEYEASHNALHGLAQGTTRHAFITARMENMGALHEQLKELVGDGAIGMIACFLDQAQDVQNNTNISS